MWNTTTRPGVHAGASRSTATRLAAAAVAALALAGGMAGRARADVTVYSNIDNFTGEYDVPSATPATVAGGHYAGMFADDITPVAGYANHAVSSVDFSAYNTDQTNPVTLVAQLRFYAANGTGGGPGTYLYGYNSGSFSLGPNADALELVNFPTTGTGTFPLPSGTFWAGLSFSDGGGTTGATAAQLGEVGQLVYDPPTVGTSANNLFDSTAAGTFGTNSPAGTTEQYDTTGGAPRANLAWSFTVAPSAVPEPATAGLLAVAAAAALGRRRQRWA